MPDRRRPLPSRSRSGSAAATARSDNPFRIGGVVSAPYFTDRDEETAHVVQALTSQQRPLLLFGPRRMGKTSLLRVVQDDLRGRGQPVILADLSTAASLTEMTTRLLQAATRELGRQWGDVATALAQRLHVRVTLEPDAASGQLLPSLGVGLEPDLGAQRTTFGSALDAIEALAEARGKQLGLILDEFQEIHKFGGETAEAHLRGIIQHHRHVSYVLAGSDERLIRAMTGKGRPFYKLLTPLRVGPIEPGHLAGWIDERLAGVGLEPGEVGARIVEVAGPRTRDIVQLAQAVVDVAGPGTALSEETITAAFTRIVHGADAPYRAIWAALARQQQQVLRVLAVRATGLTSAQVRREFGLTAPSGSITKAVQTLVAKDLVVADNARYTYDDPFMRGWVILRALPDLGITLSVLHVPDEGR